MNGDFDGIAVDAFIYKKNEQDISKGELLDLIGWLAEACEEHGYLMGGSYRLTTHEEECRKFDEEEDDPNS